MQINVETYKGIVQLSGFVDSSEIAAKAGDVARTVKGVKKVNNNLVVK
jgi:hyperosmotically inducible protein